MLDIVGICPSGISIINVVRWSLFVLRSIALQSNGPSNYIILRKNSKPNIAGPREIIIILVGLTRTEIKLRENYKILSLCLFQKNKNKF